MDEEIPYNELLLDVEDGIVVGLYHYLWMKDGKGRPCPEVNVPHTIVFTNGKPTVWYFTSGKEHCIKRKNRANISNASITEALAPLPKAATAGSDSASNFGSTTGGLGSTRNTAGSPSPHKKQHRGGSPGAEHPRPMDGTSTGAALGPWPHHGVVARFQGSMTLPHMPGAGGRGGSPGRRRRGALLELQDESVEWFSREQLHELLPPNHVVVHGVAALHEGVLQRFVQPRGQHHFSIRATWSPNACVVERRTNKAKLNDPRVPLPDRLAAWDGPIWLSEHTLVSGPVLQGTICRLCDNVAAHLADVSGGAIRVLRMVLYFMVDESSRVWLTHCGTLKTQRPREMAAGGRMRAGMGGPLPSLPLAAALRLRVPDGAGGDLGSGVGAGLDLPAPSAAFVASKAAAAANGDAGGEDDEGSGSGPSSRFLCVLTGEMYPASQRCDVTYKQLLQHWFSLASQLPNEGDRLRAMDTIPLAIRRANPSLTREWYLRVRSQPNFLYRTAPVCADAAIQLTSVGAEDLQRTGRPQPSGTGAGPSTPGGAARSNPGGAEASTPTAPGRGSNAGRISTASAASPSQIPPRPRPATALGNTTLGPANGGPGAPRGGSRQTSQSQLPQQQAASRGGPLIHRSKSASHGMPASRHRSSNGGGLSGSVPDSPFIFPTMLGGGSSAHPRLGSVPSAAVGGSILPSMLLPRDNHAGVAGVGAGATRATTSVSAPSALLQVYGPTPEQEAEAAAAAATLPYDVLDEARQSAGNKPPYVNTAAGSQAATSAPYAASAAAMAAAKASSSSSNNRAHGTSYSPLEEAISPSTSATTLAAVPTPTSVPSRTTISAPPGSMTVGPVPSGGGSGFMWGGPRPATRRSHMRTSASSEVAELGSIPSCSEPSSPNGPPTFYHQQMVGVSGPSTTTRLSPPRAAGLLTLQTIHEEGATAPQSSTRAGQPLGEELYFPPPRGAGSHSVPRMRPPTRGGSDRPPPPGSGLPSRRQLSPGHMHGSPYAYHSGSGAASVAQRSLSESGDIQPQGAQPGGGFGCGSLNSTMASSVGSMASRRSTSTQALLSNDDIRTLRELSEAYTAAERMTQQLLAQAHEILSEDGGSRPASNGTSPLHGGRVSQGALGGGRVSQGSRAEGADAGAGGASKPPAGRWPSSSGAGGNGGSASGSRAGSTGSGRAGGASPMQRISSTLGPSPLGQNQFSRQDSGQRAQSVGSNDGSGGNETPVQSGQASMSPELSSVPSGLKAVAGGQPRVTDELECGGSASAAQTQVEIGLLTSAEADLLAEALQD
ncbi:hypothetical protein Agub_g1019 [Astrephomene gubernaculifera]|uniref:Uncharacterized protein n=1 Tax=Astrephomene gubernaculifera TaxID=47775 RepID=A0AAD3HH67_9CHLO|nr:hypothetical protein Agub_g1019 [Astrephomene gubernaculifera]